MLNLKTVFRFEYVRTISKPSFWVATLALPAILAVVTGLLVLSDRSSEQAAQQTQQDSRGIVVLDQSGLVSEESIKTIEAQPVSDKQKAIDDVRSGTNKAFIFYPQNLRTEKIEVYVDSDDAISSTTFNQAALELLKQSVAADLGNSVQVLALTGQAQVNTTTFNGGEESDLIQKAIAPGLFLVLFYILVILLSNQMLNSTSEEKENRTVETVLVTLHPRTLILGKMIAIIMAGFTQILAILAPVIIGYVLFKDRISAAVPNIDLSQIVIDPERILFAVAYFLLGFVIFTAINVIAGALAPSAKEAGAFYGVSVFSMFVPFYAFVSLISAPDSLITRVFTYFPLTQPVTLLLRNAVDNLGSIEQWVTLFIMIISAVGGIALAVRAFRYGALEYSRKIKFSELIPTIKSKGR